MYVNPALERLIILAETILIHRKEFSEASELSVFLTCQGAAHEIAGFVG